MGSDMVVALHEASANGTTLFGLNHHAAPEQRHLWRHAAAHCHEAGEVLRFGKLELSQAKHTCAVLGLQPVGQWGLAYGVNEHRVAIGVTSWRSRLGAGDAPLDGQALVRLALERGKSALLATEVITDLLERHGQSGDHIFLIAGADEAYLLETCGRHWALLECGHLRVVTDAAMIRQDWRRLAPGLADHVIEQGWWRDDGSKIDFVRTLAETTEAARKAQKRWGHASLTLSQQNGAIDLHFLRRMLGDHYLASQDLFAAGRSTTLASSFLIDLHRSDAPVLAWFAFGTPRSAVHFPICLGAELPTIPIEEHAQKLAKLAAGKERERVSALVERLQTRFDQDAEDLQARAHELAQHGKTGLVHQAASEMMHHHAEMFDHECRRLLGGPEKIPASAEVEEEVLFFA